MAVRTDFQGKGVGQKLIQYGLDTMAERGVSLAFTYGDPAFYGRIGFERITIEQFPAPRELSYPHGWLAKSLSQHPLESITGSSQCVKMFDKPELW